MRKEYDFSRARRGAVIPDHKASLVTPDQRAELDRRLAAYKIDRNRGRPAEDVLADVYHRLRQER